MHTPELSDDELDALFRHGAEHYPDELNLGAWSRMEQRLDAAHVQQLVNRKVARLFAAEMGIVAVVLLLWGTYRYYAGLNEKAPAGLTAQQAAARPGAAVAGMPDNSQTATRLQPPRTTTEAAALAARTSSVAPAASAAVGPSAAGTRSEASAPQAAPGVRVRSGLGLAPAAVTIRVPGVAEGSRENLQATDDATSRHPARQATQSEPLSGTTATAGSAGQEGGTRRKAGSRRLTREQLAELGVPAAGNARSALLINSEVAGPYQPVSASEAASEATPAATYQPAETPVANQAATAAGAEASRQSGEAAEQGRNADAGTGSTTETAATAAAATNADNLEALTTPLVTEVAALPEALAGTAPMRQLRPAVPSRIFITGLYAPELSTVRRAGFTHPGHSAGIQVEYLLTPRLRLSVGLLSSVKYYYAHGSDYTFARPQAYPVERIDATCRITDIPVNLRFDAWRGMRGRVFGSAGASSLLMRDEVYKYSYQVGGNLYSRTWGVKNGKNHPFSVLNVSAGYEYQLSPRWSAQAEPFLKLPLGGVGMGSVRLSSGGVFFGLKYGL